MRRNRGDYLKNNVSQLTGTCEKNKKYFGGDSRKNTPPNCIEGVYR